MTVTMNSPSQVKRGSISISKRKTLLQNPLQNSDTFIGQEFEKWTIKIVSLLRTGLVNRNTSNGSLKEKNGREM